MSHVNILLICSDQHARRVTGCYGHTQVRTPNLDALAARGVRFTQAYTPSPVCVSARACMATGYYAHQVAAWDNAAPYTGTAATSWGHALRASGVHVTTIGKLHYSSTSDPTGFDDQRLAMHVKGGSGNLYGLLRDAMPPLTTFRPQIENAAAGWSDYARYDTAVADAAARWLGEEARDHERWALMVSFAQPHPPFIAPPDFAALYPPGSVDLPVNWQADDWPHHPALDWLRSQQMIDTPFPEEAVRSAITTYYGMVSYVDTLTGRVLDALEASRQADNTLVIYTSDHGEMLGTHGLWFKCCMYEDSVGVPLLMAGPGLSRGAICDTAVSLVDLYPTLLDAADASPPADEPPRPGRSLLDVATGPVQTRPVFSEFHGALSRSGLYMLREGRWKYVYSVGAPPQLFDLETDPHERYDLAPDPGVAGVMARLHAKLAAVVDPDDADRLARADQLRRLEAAGGRERLLAEGFSITYTPPPEVPGNESLQASRLTQES